MGLKFLDWLTRVRIFAISLTTLALVRRLDNPHKIKFDKPLKPTYDFIVVGAGSGGAVMASRLSEDRHHDVLVLEAGEDGTVFTELPLATTLVYGTPRYDWGFRSTRDPRSCRGFRQGVCVLPRGKMLGGSSAVNGLMYIRGNREDYNQWERLGNPGWGYEDVLPYFIRAEDNQDIDKTDPGFHGVGGPLAVSSPRFITSLGPVWLRAGASLGYPPGDVNGASQSRFMLHQSTAKLGKRWSTARGYLRPASWRHNLNIQVRAVVTRIIIDPLTKRARGVVFYKNKKRHVVWARKEIILSAGAFKSPQILKLSGVGPCEELARHKIPCLHPLPGVGENLQSHFGVGGAEYLVKKGLGLTLLSLINPVAIFRYLFKRRGPLTSNLGIEGTAFIDSKLNNASDFGVEWPDIQLLFYPIQLAVDGGIIFREFLSMTPKLWSQFSPNSFRGGYRIVPINLRPTSRGRVLLRSRNPWQDPAIQLNLFDDPRDLAVMTQAGLLADQVGLSPPFLAVGARPSRVPSPFCSQFPDRSPDWWSCQARVFSETIYHDTSTCAMGPPSDPLSVVDNQLRVYGISGLRVVDVSVMPRIVSGNTNAPTIMIAEKAADLVRAHWHARHLGLDPNAFVEERVLQPHRRTGRLFDLSAVETDHDAEEHVRLGRRVSGSGHNHTAGSDSDVSTDSADRNVSLVSVQDNGTGRLNPNSADVIGGISLDAITQLPAQSNEDAVALGYGDLTCRFSANCTGKNDIFQDGCNCTRAHTDPGNIRSPKAAASEDFSIPEIDDETLKLLRQWMASKADVEEVGNSPDSDDRLAQESASSYTEPRPAGTGLHRPQPPGPADPSDSTTASSASEEARRLAQLASDRYWYGDDVGPPQSPPSPRQTVDLMAKARTKLDMLFKEMERHPNLFT